MQDKTELKIDWCSHKAAKYACEHWHYSKKIPVNKLVKIGAWENNKFIGVIIFGVGASAQIHKQFSLKNTEVCELVRVALTKHKIEVTYLIKRALLLLKESNPKLRVCVSFADPSEGHHGGIYQAGNWIYTGDSASTTEYFYNKKWRHTTDVYKRLTAKMVYNLPKRKKEGKHRYVMPLDKKMRKQIESLRQPYPRPPSVAVNTSSVQDEAGGSNPTGELLTTVELEAV